MKYLVFRQIFKIQHQCFNQTEPVLGRPLCLHVGRIPRQSQGAHLMSKLNKKSDAVVCKVKRVSTRNCNKLFSVLMPSNDIESSAHVV